MNRLTVLLAVFLATLLSAQARAQHLWWDLRGQKDATDLYGEITVLDTAPHIYYCGANWHPGEPAGGYCGIQHNSENERRTIFSIWDTTAALHPTITAADPRTLHNRFGGEGEGGHTHMIWPWNVGETFQFYVHKQPGKDESTDTFYYVFDRTKDAWIHSATINSPNGGKKSVATIGGGLNSFLENFAGKDKATPKLALYRLWLGTSVDTMKCLTKAHGDGTWGQMHGAYFLAEGDPKALEATFAANKEKYGAPTRSEKGKKLDPIPDAPVPETVIAALKNLPKAPELPPSPERSKKMPKPSQDNPEKSAPGK
ncbi:MAG TPA: DUF3472 domain-containing protein [Phycisphaerales bacterium]|nr:DUF3472 domain-containing protein [Phycisphaerales bacterium]